MYYLRILFYIWLPITLLGLLTGTINYMNPEAVFIPDGTGTMPGHEGMMGIYSALASSALLGLIIGVCAMGIAWLFGMGVKKIENSDKNLDETDPAGEQ